MSSIVELGLLDGDAAKPIFRASAGGRDFIVELDGSALRKLAGRLSWTDWRKVAEGERSRVLSAAQELYDGGFLTGEAEPRLLITAIDIV